MRLVALVTCAVIPNLTDDDRSLIPALAAQGVSAAPAVWDDDAVEWRTFDAVVIRSTWDYHRKAQRFLSWIDRVDALDVPLINPAPVLRWNADKIYLRELSALGVPVVPTWWVEQGDWTPLVEILRQTGWSRAVVKPAVAATAYRTWTTDAASAAADETRFRELVADGRVLVQPFVEAITTEGEWSFVFFGGEHALSVLKVVKRGDFRVQNEFGGSVLARDADPAIVAQASDVLDAAPFSRADLAYARVDGCVENGRFVLMELEVLEPALFLQIGRGRTEVFASHLAQRVAHRANSMDKG